MSTLSVAFSVYCFLRMLSLNTQRKNKGTFFILIQNNEGPVPWWCPPALMALVWLIMISRSLSNSF